MGCRISAAVSFRPYQSDFLKSRQNFLETLLTFIKMSESEDGRREAGDGEDIGEEVGDGILETGDGDQETGIRERRGEMALDS